MAEASKREPRLRRSCRDSVKKKYLPIRKQQWSKSEKLALVGALKGHGFGDMGKIADVVGTRSQAEVEYFIDKWTKKVYDERFRYGQCAFHKLFSRTNLKRSTREMNDFAPIVVWKKALHYMMTSKTVDHSEVLADLYQKYYEEEPEPECSDPNMPNYKQVYKFICDTLRGTIPATLSPVNEAVFDSLIRDMVNFIAANDLEEESNFMDEFMGPTKFRVLRIKTEEEKAGKSAQGSAEESKAGCSTASDTAPGDGGVKIEEEIFDGDPYPEGKVISVPEEFFDDLIRHRKAKEDINPMLVPVWLLLQEQRRIADYFANVPR